MAEGLLFEEGLFVLLMPDALLHDILFHALCFLDVFAAGLKDRVHLGAQANVFGNGALRTLVLHFPQHLFVGGAVQWVIRWVFRGVVELWMFGHVFVDVLRLDLEEETVVVGVEELTPVPVLFPELVVIEVIYQVFLEIQNTHPYIHWATELQTALVVLDSRQGVMKILARANAGLAMRRLSLSSSFLHTSFTSTRFRRFSMVFPKTELFISL